MSIRILVLAGALLTAGAAMAQMQPELIAPNRAIGRRIDSPGVRAIYAPYHQTEPFAGVQITRDVPYGPGELETFDVVTSGEGRGKPVLIYVHGGGYVGGDKAPIENGKRSPFYDNIMVWAVRHGMVGVNMNYPLAPATQYPVVQQDIGKVIAWTRANIARSGGDPNKIFLMGFSAGGGHVAAYVSHPEYFPAGGSGLKGAIIASGGFDNTDTKPHAYFGPVATLAERSATAGLAKSNIPLLIANAEFDPEEMLADRAAAEKVLRAARTDVTFAMLKDHNHLSQMQAIGTTDQSMAMPLEQFIKTTSARP